MLEKEPTVSDSKDKRPRSPNFPYVSLEEALSLVEKLYKQDKQNYVPLKIALKNMSLSVNSSTSRRVVSAMLEYGLLEDRGEGDDKELIVSGLARNIILDERQNSPERLSNIREAALNSKIMYDAWDNWKGEIPSDDTVKYTLISKWGFTDRAAARFTKVVQENFEFADLDNYYEKENEPESYQPIQQQLYNSPTKQKQIKTTIQQPQIGVLSDWLDFNLSLGADQRARLLISNLLSEDDFEFLIVWIKRLKNDIVEKSHKQNVENNENEIPF